MVKKTPKNIKPNILLAVVACVTLVIQSAMNNLIAIEGVAPALLVVCATVGSLHLNAAEGVLFGGLCGLFTDALVPNLALWVYTALLAVICGAVSSASAYTNRSRIVTAFFWSAVVLVVVGAVEVLIFGILRGSGLPGCIKTAGIQAVYSLVFVLPFEELFNKIEKHREKV